MKVKFHRWFQWFAVPFVALGFHIYFGYKVIGRENIPAGGCVVCPNHIQLSDPPFAAVALSHRTPLRLMRARLAPLARMVTSAVTCRSPRCTRADTIACSQPARTSGRSCGTRWDRRRERYPIASTRFVFPQPLGATNVVTPRSSSRSNDSYDRKSRSASLLTHTQVPPPSGKSQKRMIGMSR